MEVPKKDFKSYLFTLVYLPFFGLSLVFFDIIARITKFIYPSKLQSLMYLLNKWMLTIMKIVGTEIEIKNKSDISRDYPTLFVSNHQSLMDIPLIYCLYPQVDTKFIAKKELSKFFPFVSYMLRNGEHAIIDRSDRKQAFSEIKRFCKRINETKKAIMIFPEGTRARDGKLKPFKFGGIKQIINEFEKIQIVPLVIDGSYLFSYYKLLPVPYGKKITINVGKPLLEIDNLELIEDKIKELLEEIRNDKKTI